MPRDIGTALIEPKTPFYARFEVLAFILDRAQNPNCGRRSKAKAARFRAAHPEQVSNLANRVTVPEQLGCPIRDGRL
jgi:hypothetical protein